MIKDILPTEYAEFIALLETSGLPSDDVSYANWKCLVGFYDGNNDLVAGAGLEHCDTNNALLRSVVTRPDHQCQGYARKLVEALHTRAAAQEIRSVWLLTTTASLYFSNVFEYIEVPRFEAPQSIVETQQFSALCPNDAILMKTEITH